MTRVVVALLSLALLAGPISMPVGVAVKLALAGQDTAQVDRAWCQQPTADVLTGLPRDHLPFVDWVAIKLAALRVAHEGTPNDATGLPVYRELSTCVEQLKRVFAARPPDSLGTDGAVALGVRIDLDSFASRSASTVFRLELDEQREAVRRRMIETKKWPSDIEQAVLGRRVRLGMTTEQVELAWGINETRSMSGLSEQWVYRGESTCTSPTAC